MENSEASHQDLDRAAEDVIDQETGVPEIEETQETPEEIQAKQRDEENAERSKLGRKVKEMETNFSGIQDQLNRLASLLEQKQKDPEFDDDEIITAKNLPDYLKRKEQEQNQQKQAYEKDYTSTFARIGAEDDDFDNVWNEMLANHNTIHTSDPKIDAQINYLSAKNSLLKKPKNPLQGKGKDVQGVNVPNTTKHEGKGMPKLDPVADEFVKRMGLSADWVNEKLGK